MSEWKGPGRHNPAIIQYFREAGQGWVRDDETAWCAAFVNAMLHRAGIEGVQGVNALRARAFMRWGLKLLAPEPGCIVVLPRGSNPAEGHVGFLDRQEGPYVQVLGGNQGNSVSIRAFEAVKVIGWRWPRLTGVCG